MKIGAIGNENVFLKNNSLMNAQRKDFIKEGLQNQIANIQKQMASISENKELSVEQKKEMQKDLKEQLEGLNKQMMERKLEIRKEQEKNQEEKIKEQLKTESSNSSNQDEMTDLFRVTNALNQVKTQRAVSVKMKGGARVLESDIKLDESRGLDVPEKRKQLSEMKDRIENIDKKIGETMKNVNSEINKEVKEEKVENDEKVLNEKTDKEKDKNNPDPKHIDKRV